MHTSVVGDIESLMAGYKLPVNPSNPNRFLLLSISQQHQKYDWLYIFSLSDTKEKVSYSSQDYWKPLHLPV